MPKILCLHNIDQYLEGAVLDASAFTPEQTARLKKLSAIRAISAEEEADFLDEVEEEEETPEAAPAKPAKTIRSMNKTELAQYAAEHGLLVPEGTRDRMIASIEASLSGEDNAPLLKDKAIKQEDPTGEGTPTPGGDSKPGGSMLPDDI